MCFSNKIQVKYSLLKNFAFKNLWKRDKGYFNKTKTKFEQFYMNATR